MPTLIRLSVVLGILAALAYGVMWAMVTYMEPHAHVITQTVTIPRPQR